MSIEDTIFVAVVELHVQLCFAKFWVPGIRCVRAVFSTNLRAAELLD